MQELNIIMLQPGEESLASQLIASVFDRYIAPDYSLEGVGHFREYINAESFRQRMQTDNHFQLTAWCDQRMVGLIEIRDWNHISLLFVDNDFHRLGIARQLLDQAAAYCGSQDRSPLSITVKASPYAFSAGIYGRLGFVQSEPQQEQNGITFIPMRKDMQQSL